MNAEGVSPLVGVLAGIHIAMDVFFRQILPVPPTPAQPLVVLASQRPASTSSAQCGRGGKMRRLKPTLGIPLPYMPILPLNISAERNRSYQLWIPSPNYFTGFVQEVDVVMVIVL